MGDALLGLLQHVRWLRVFLRVRARSGLSTGLGVWLGLDGAAGHMPLPPWGTTRSRGRRRWAQMGVVQQLRVGLRLMMTACLGGSRTWVVSDPVWYVFFLLAFLLCGELMLCGMFV